MKFFSIEHAVAVVFTVIVGMVASLFEPLRGFDWAVLYLLTHAMYEKPTN
jgi:hypothetical protein